MPGEPNDARTGLDDPGEVVLPRQRSCPFDPPDDYRAMTRGGPLHRLHFPTGGNGWVVTQHAAAKAVLADSRFSHRSDLLASPLPLPFEPPPGVPMTPPAPEPGAFNRMDPPDHTRYRRLVGSWFSARRAEQMVPKLEESAAGLLETMAAAGAPADLVRHYARPLPAKAIFDLLDVPEDVRAPLHDNLDVLMRLEVDLDELITAVTIITELLDELAEQKMTGAGGGLLGEVSRRGGLERTELRNIAWALLGGGTDTSANMIALGTVALLAHPEQLARLRREPELMDNAVEELLRHLTISQFGASRAATEDLTVLGHPVGVGETVVVALPAANRDPRAFPDPDRLDLTRDPKGHLAFGYGVHKCIGQYLARVTLRVAFGALLRRFPELDLAVELDDLRMRHDMDHYGVHEVLVTW